ncbi:MAG: hypothetical protein KKB50_00280 [Planctomycetes bacterium]|nr:hypothetical protein [Planctomycetota bacterium]
MPDSLRPHIQRIIDDMQTRKYPPQRFMQALAWPGCDDAELLERAIALLRNPDGQTTAFEYKRRYPDGHVLEDIVIEDGIALAVRRGSRFSAVSRGAGGFF